MIPAGLDKDFEEKIDRLVAIPVKLYNPQTGAEIGTAHYQVFDNETGLLATEMMFENVLDANNFINYQNVNKGDNELYPYENYLPAEENE